MVFQSSQSNKHFPWREIWIFYKHNELDIAPWLFYPNYLEKRDFTMFFSSSNPHYVCKKTWIHSVIDRTMIYWTVSNKGLGGGGRPSMLSAILSCPQFNSCKLTMEQLSIFFVVSTLRTFFLAGKEFHTFQFIRWISYFYFSCFDFPPL